MVKNLIAIPNAASNWNTQWWPNVDENHLLAVHVCDQIQLYRLTGLEGFRLMYQIESKQQIDCLMNSANYLYLFFNENKCTDQNKEDNQSRKHYLEIIAPKYRKNMFG